MGTLSVGWVADQLLALHTLTGNATYLTQGELALGVLNLFQQVHPRLLSTVSLTNLTELPY